MEKVILNPVLISKLEYNTHTHTHTFVYLHKLKFDKILPVVHVSIPLDKCGITRRF